MTTTDISILRPPGVVAKHRPTHPLPGLTPVQAARAWLQHLRRRPVYRDHTANSTITRMATEELELATAEARRIGGVE